MVGFFFLTYREREREREGIFLSFWSWVVLVACFQVKEGMLLRETWTGLKSVPK